MRPVQRVLVVVSCVLGAAGVGCKSDETNAQRPVTPAERASLSSIVGQINTIKGTPGALMANPSDSATILASVSYGDFESLVNPVATKAAAHTPRAMLPACVTASATMATLASCDIMGHSVSGTVSLNGNAVTADVTDTFSLTTGAMGSAHVTGTATVTDTSIDGMASLDLSYTDGTKMHTLTVTADFQNVDVTGCGTMLPKGGTLVLTGSGNVGMTTISATRTVTFGPACGDAKIE